MNSRPMAQNIQALTLIFTQMKKLQYSFRGGMKLTKNGRSLLMRQHQILMTRILIKPTGNMLMKTVIITLPIKMQRDYYLLMFPKLTVIKSAEKIIKQLTAYTLTISLQQLTEQKPKIQVVKDQSWNSQMTFTGMIQFSLPMVQIIRSTLNSVTIMTEQDFLKANTE